MYGQQAQLMVANPLLTTPLGMLGTAPRFRWQLQEGVGQLQTQQQQALTQQAAAAAAAATLQQVWTLKPLVSFWCTIFSTTHLPRRVKGFFERPRVVFEKTQDGSMKNWSKVFTKLILKSIWNPNLFKKCNFWWIISNNGPQISKVVCAWLHLKVNCRRWKLMAPKIGLISA